MFIKVSDYIIKFLEEKKIRDVFVVSGGAALHLINSAGLSKKVNIIPMVHEQAAAMAADNYSRVTNNIGAAIVTSGPGATNLVTGVCGAYFDSIPTIYITGQVSTFRSKNKTGVRQIGFQETDCISIFKSITKYAVKIKKADEIVYELHKAYHIATSGRKGPVLIDIPDNLQRQKINIKKIKKYKANKLKLYNKNNLNNKIKQMIKMTNIAKRPIIILGWGIHLSNSSKIIKKLCKKIGFPVVTTWAMAHLFEAKDPLSIGTWGTHGTRFSNLAVQNSDLVISIGSRLDTKATGSPVSTFAREAKKIMIDIDETELNKFKNYNLKIDLKINCDANKIIQKLLKKKLSTNKVEVNKWFIQINKWKEKYPIVLKKYYKEKEINPYIFVKKLSAECKKNELICVDTGCAIAWMMQAFEFKKDQKLFHDFNNTAMGWALPGAIAASIALKRRKIISVIGDGSFQLNIQELGTLVKHNLPIKIFLINNSGQSMIRQTQEQWLNAKYFASSFEGGLPKINFLNIATEYGLKTFSCSLNKSLKEIIRKTIQSKGPALCEIKINTSHRVVPQVKFGYPNEDLEPLLPRKEFLQNMIIKAL